MVDERNQSQKDRFIQVRYRPYNILSHSKKIGKTSIKESQHVQSIPQNGHGSNISVQPFKRVPQTSVQQH